MTNPSSKTSAAPRLCESKTGTTPAGKGKAKGKRKRGLAPLRLGERDQELAPEAVIDACVVDPSTTRCAGGSPPHLASQSGEDRERLLNTGCPLHHPADGPPPPSSSGEDRLACTRKTRRQATSRTAYKAAPPEEDDPLLAFEPYLHPQPRSNSITPDKQRAFVSQLAATGIVQQAARHIGKSMEALYKLRARPGAEGFAAAWDAAVERGVTRLEDCALERAIQGTPTPIVGRDAIIGWWHKPDNGLLRFLLQHRLPQRYGVQDLKSGHPVYDSIAAEAVEAYKIATEQTEDEVYASIDRKMMAWLGERKKEWAREYGLIGEDGLVLPPPGAATPPSGSLPAPASSSAATGAAAPAASRPGGSVRVL